MAGIRPGTLPVDPYHDSGKACLSCHITSALKEFTHHLSLVVLKLSRNTQQAVEPLIEGSKDYGNI